uniref:Uncharacterized protein n=1 Tax=Sphaerodactylus townsendi TaxID=933632 RepID=A0ACB8FEZ3_9SAUR
MDLHRECLLCLSKTYIPSDCKAYLSLTPRTHQGRFSHLKAAFCTRSPLELTTYPPLTGSFFQFLCTLDIATIQHHIHGNIMMCIVVIILLLDQRWKFPQEVHDPFRKTLIIFQN